MTSLRGAVVAEGRYRRLRADIDADLFNNRWREVDVSHTPNNFTEVFDYVDLFSGAGGISCGLSQAGFRKLLSNEIDPDASATIRRNFPQSVHFEGSIEHLRIADHLPKLKRGTLPLLIGGPPCQGFSVAGYRRPDDPRNKLVEHFLRIVDETHPWFVIIENVPGILTLAKGVFKEAVIKSLQDMGYQASVRILEAAEFGVPQMRARAFFVANRFGMPNPYPKPQLRKSDFIPIETCIDDLEKLVADPKINHEWTRHSKLFEERISQVPPGGSLYESFRDAFKRQHLGVPSMTIKENHGGTHIHPKLNRVISAREMARLQSFPDSYYFCGTMKRAMWQIGNAVPARLSQVIGLALRSSLESLHT